MLRNQCEHHRLVLSNPTPKRHDKERKISNLTNASKLMKYDILINEHLFHTKIYCVVRDLFSNYSKYQKLLSWFSNAGINTEKKNEEMEVKPDECKRNWSLVKSKVLVKGVFSQIQNSIVVKIRTRSKRGKCLPLTRNNLTPPFILAWALQDVHPSYIQDIQHSLIKFPYGMVNFL